MRLDQLPRLSLALGLMGIDNGASVAAGVELPAEWDDRARLAEAELMALSIDEIETLAQGEQTDQEAIAARAKNADEILQAAFDLGELADLIFRPCENIYQARAAETAIAAERVKVED